VSASISIVNLIKGVPTLSYHAACPASASAYLQSLNIANKFLSDARSHPTFRTAQYTSHTKRLIHTNLVTS